MDAMAILHERQQGAVTIKDAAHATWSQFNRQRLASPQYWVTNRHSSWTLLIGNINYYDNMILLQHKKQFTLKLGEAQVISVFV